MLKGLRERINYIRYGSLEKRRKWFLGTIIFIFSLVLIVWLIFSLNIFPKNNSDDSSSPKAKSDFFSVLTNGFNLAGQELKNIFQSREINIEK